LHDEGLIHPGMDKTITRHEAREIAAALTGCPPARLKVLDTPLGRWRLYNCPKVPAWSVVIPGELPLLQGARVVVIAKCNGAVLFNGRANDEG
jgi:hypothetical protein